LYQGVSLLTPNRAVFFENQRTRRSREKLNQCASVRDSAPLRTTPNHPRQALYQGVSLLTPNRLVFPKKQRTRRSRDEIQSMQPHPQLRTFTHLPEPSAPSFVSGREFTHAETRPPVFPKKQRTRRSRDQIQSMQPHPDSAAPPSLIPVP
jgi:hypothetical protein